MLKDSLYHILSITNADGTINAVIELNADDEIFQGHFPEQPVLPGACMLQMVKEVLEDELKTSYSLQKADNLKFLATVDPRSHRTLYLEANYSTDENGTRVNATLNTDEQTVFKLQATFIAG